MCSHPRIGDATDEKIAEKNRKKFNELNFLRQKHGLCQRVATLAIFAAPWRRDNFKKIASPSQAKNRSCSRGLKQTVSQGENEVFTGTLCYHKFPKISNVGLRQVYT